MRIPEDAHDRPAGRQAQEPIRIPELTARRQSRSHARTCALSFAPSTGHFPYDTRRLISDHTGLFYPHEIPKTLFNIKQCFARLARVGPWRCVHAGSCSCDCRPRIDGCLVTETSRIECRRRRPVPFAICVARVVRLLVSFHRCPPPPKPGELIGSESDPQTSGGLNAKESDYRRVEDRNPAASSSGR